jgi:integrase
MPLEAPDRLDPAPVAQLDRASVYETEGHRFESCQARFGGPPLGLLKPHRYATFEAFAPGSRNRWGGNGGGNKATRPRRRERSAAAHRAPRRLPSRGRFVAVYRRGGRQRKESAASFAEARALKLAREAEERAERGGPLLHEHMLAWVGAYNGSGHDSVNEATRREYRRLLVTFALRYFSAELRLAELDREAPQGFVSWLIAYRGERGRLSDRSIRNAVAPLRLCLLAAAEEGLVDREVPCGLLLPRRRGGRGWDFEQGRFLTRTQLAALLTEIPFSWQPFFDLLVTTGLRVSEAIALRWRDLEPGSPPCLWVRRSIVNGVVGAPKSRFGRRRLPLPEELMERLVALRPADAGEDELVFATPTGAPQNPNNIRHRVLWPAIERAGVPRVGFHAFRHTCASLLIERGLSPLRLQRWMGHHSAPTRSMSTGTCSTPSWRRRSTSHRSFGHRR